MSYRAIIKVQTSSYSEGIKSGFPISIGYMPIALTFGLLSKTYDLSFLESISMSIIVFAGAAQFMGLQMIGAGTGSLEIILATFIVNIRHLLMSASINERADKKDSLIKRVFYAFGITDETFSVASLYKGPINAMYMFGLITMAYGSWVVFTGVGYTIGASLPEVLQKSMSIALYAMFIGLAVPSMKRYRKMFALFVTAAVLNSIFILFLSSGWAIVAATVSSAIGVEILAKGERSHV